MKIPLLLLCVTACGAREQAAATPQKPTTTAAMSPTPTFRVLSETELTRRTKAAEAKSPLWSIVLDPIGMLSSARCELCGMGKEITPEDHKRIDEFLAKQDDLVWLSGPNVIKKYDLPHGILFHQEGDTAPIANVHINHDRHLTISSHLWPALPTGTDRQSDEKLTQHLTQLDTSAEANLTIVHKYVMTAATLEGPIELHETVCLYNATDDIEKKHAKRPCVDARTGQDLTSMLVGTTVSTSDGVVTRRALVR